MLGEFDTMATEYNFHTIDASQNIEEVFEQVKARVEPLLISSKAPATIV
jgi:thymidylate kinase